jgi:hypothetical protein
MTRLKHVPKKKETKDAKRNYLWKSTALFFTSAAVEFPTSDVLDCLRPERKVEAPPSLLYLTGATGSADIVVPVQVPGGTGENVKPVLFSAVSMAVSFFPGSLGESKPDKETVGTDAIGLSLTGEPTFSLNKFVPTFCSAFCSFLFDE